MKQQVVVIHGGRTFPAYEEYVHSLKTREVNAEKFKYQKNWRDSFGEALGAGFEVLNPKMPNGNNAVYEEWKIWFERMAEFLHDNVVLIGQSLGGIFLARYLAEHAFSKKIKALVLIAAPFDEEGLHESLCSFALPSSLENVARQAPKISLVFSTDDPVVPYLHVAKYQKVFPEAEVIRFEDRGHFDQSAFLELVEMVKRLV